jgi:PAS domain S-box-containing protein
MLSGELVWSDELYRLFGLDPSQARASFEAWRRIVHPEDLEAAEQRIRDAVQNQSPLESEYRIVLPTGGLRWIYALGKTTRDGAGRPVRMSGICLDITGRKQAEQQVIATTQRLQALMEALPVGVSFSEDRSCQRIMGNATLLAQFEATSEDNVSASAPEPQAAGRRVRYLLEGRELSDAELPLQRAAAEGRVVPPTELEIHLPSGRHWFAEVSGAPLRDEKGRVVAGLAVVVDVTARRQAEDALRDAARRKDEFLAMLAHELRNPLTPLRTAAEIMGRLDLAEPRLRWVQRIIGEQVTHLSRLVDDLLDVSRIVRGKIRLAREPLELAPLVRRFVAAVEPSLAAKARTLSLHLPEQPVWLDADPVRLTQIMINLLDNADKFTAEGGHIELAARLGGDEVAISVRDDGCGIPPELLPAVFDLFQQGEVGLDRGSGGLGIGLTLVQRLAALHGGRVVAQSDGAGRGATFTVWLPVTVPPARVVAASPPARAAAASPTRILVVDDDAAVADSTALWLEMEGYEVRVARSGPEALEQAPSFDPRIVILDIGLAGMDGYETATRLRGLASGSDLYLVAVTGYGHEEAVARAKAAGFDRHLTKPFDPKALLALLAEAMASREGR